MKSSLRVHNYDVEIADTGAVDINGEDWHYDGEDEVRERFNVWLSFEDFERIYLAAKAKREARQG